MYEQAIRKYPPFQVHKSKIKFEQRYPEWMGEATPRSQRPKSGLLYHDLMIMKAPTSPTHQIVKVLLVLVISIIASHSSLLDKEIAVSVLDRILSSWGK